MRTCPWCGSTQNFWAYNEIPNVAVCHCSQCNYLLAIHKDPSFVTNAIDIRKLDTPSDD